MSDAAGAGSLRRVLGLRDVVLFMVIAGSNLQWVATAAASGPSSLAVWILGACAMFLPLGVSVAFLSSRFPDQGGLYVWSKLAFGPFAGFMTGWTYWTANLPYLPGLLYFAAGSLLYASGGPTTATLGSPFYFMAFSLGGLALAVYLNVRGLGVAKWLNNVGGVARWCAMALLAGFGAALWWRFGSATPLDARSLTPGVRLVDVVFWSTIALAWTGPEAAAFMGGEIREPRRTLPLALGLAAPLIAGIYLIGTLSVLVAVPPAHTSALYGVMEATAVAAQRFGMSWIQVVTAFCVSLSCVASVGAWLGATARIPFAAGIDHYLPKSFARLHPRYGSPTVAIAAQAVIAGLFAVLGQAGTSVKGAYDILVDMTVITTMLPFLSLFGAAIRLSRGPGRPGELRIPGGRVTIVALALVGLATTVGATVLAFMPAPEEVNPTLAMFKVAGLTAIILAAGAAVYATGKARALRLSDPGLSLRQPS
jgi:amino acid transporter